jgi:hypothetical protein
MVSQPDYEFDERYSGNFKTKLICILPIFSKVVMFHQTIASMYLFST